MPDNRERLVELAEALGAQGGMLVGGGGGKGFEVTILFTDLDAAWRCNNALMAISPPARSQQSDSDTD
jgi:galactokinase/mevalonate kinase-like predicted kinase